MVMSTTICSKKGEKKLSVLFFGKGEPMVADIGERGGSWMFVCQLGNLE